jgi:hypothetical protein
VIEGGLSINETRSLASLEGLNNLVHIGVLNLTGCSSLTSLDELSGVTNELQGLNLIRNSQLGDIDGLSNAAGQVGSLNILSNPSLTSIAELPPRP